ncbi:hypothetical protein CYMTET_19721 [Cymbomonas tetramitiformis]|uniref:Uncharacterized protein n=1 Tax=Cymbomonas tetramitiformis TaxID=36881 RepID=A0AAE0G5H7_9CHLO|nr:hypothetical protein CYMTET_19721 [Cymbomonas tetramitiformis]
MDTSSRSRNLYLYRSPDVYLYPEILIPEAKHLSHAHVAAPTVLPDADAGITTGNAEPAQEAEGMAPVLPAPNQAGVDMAHQVMEERVVGSPPEPAKVAPFTRSMYDALDRGSSSTALQMQDTLELLNQLGGRFESEAMPVPGEDHGTTVASDLAGKESVMAAAEGMPTESMGFQVQGELPTFQVLESREDRWGT